jgi:hypothetical protein
MGGPSRRIALAFLITRVLLVGAALVPWPLARCTEYAIADEAGGAHVQQVPWKQAPDGTTYYGLPHSWLDSFVRMDAEYYLFISVFGYEPNHPRAPGFLPGYPVAVGAVARGVQAASGNAGQDLLGAPVVLVSSAFAVSNLSLLLAALLLFRLVRAFLDERAAESAAILLLVSPLSFFGSAYLAESLFLLLSIASILLAVRGRPWLAALLGATAAFTRPLGALLVVPLAMITLRRRAETRSVARDLAALLLVPIGAAGVFLWHERQLGDPWAYMRIQREVFGHADFPDLDGVAALFGVGRKDWLAITRDAVQVTCLLGAAVCMVPLLRAASARRLPLAIAAWGLVAIAVPLFSGHVISLPRYVFGAFPVFVGAAMLLPSGHRGGVYVVSTILQLAAFVVFTRAWPVFV